MSVQGVYGCVGSDMSKPVYSGPLGSGKSMSCLREIVRNAIIIVRRKRKPRNHIYSRYFQQKNHRKHKRIA